jgi:glycosyltransferase involved in cell wall biosynthesis
MKDFKIDISVVLCCYNSSSRLRPTLEHLAKQKINSQIKWEVILIDNNSNDNTSEFAKNIWLEVGDYIPFQVIPELKPGLSNARKKGIDSAKGEILIFCDDDNWFDENYLQMSFDIMKMNMKIGMLGGIGEEVLDIDKPIWFNKYKMAYAVGAQADEDGDITFVKGYVYGAGAVIRKSVLIDIYSKGFVNQFSDRVKNILVSGGDNEIGYMIVLSGYKIYYSSKLKFKHYLPQSRLTISYLNRLIKGQSLTFYKVMCYEHYVLNKEFQFPKSRFYGSSKSLKNIIKLLLSFVKRDVSYLYFSLRFTSLAYERIYLLLYFNKFKIEIKRIENNIFIFRSK